MIDIASILILIAVHPHACGEHSSTPSMRPGWCGSSPRLWGTLFGVGFMGYAYRFIPTPVGNIARRRRHERESPVHPHACGEHWTTNAVAALYYGSSPRLWGTSARHLSSSARYRFIPTPVGNIRANAHAPVRLPVHPHACGEHAAMIAVMSDGLGSSPRLWGTFSRKRNTAVFVRFIPTPVGNINQAENK